MSGGGCQRAEEDAEVAAAADDIASKITKVLVEAFTAKEGRSPSPEEVEDMLMELTEERVMELMSGNGPEKGEKAAPDNVEGEQEDDLASDEDGSQGDDEVEEQSIKDHPLQDHDKENIAKEVVERTVSSDEHMKKKSKPE